MIVHTFPAPLRVHGQRRPVTVAGLLLLPGHTAAKIATLILTVAPAVVFL